MVQARQTSTTITITRSISPSSNKSQQGGSRHSATHDGAQHQHQQHRSAKQLFKRQLLAAAASTMCYCALLLKRHCLNLVLALALRLLFCDRCAVQQYREQQSSKSSRPFPTYFSLAARAVALACALGRGWRLGHVWQPLLCGAWARAGGGAGLATAVEEQHAYTNHSCSQEVCEHGAAIKAVHRWAARATQQ